MRDITYYSKLNMQIFFGEVAKLSLKIRRFIISHDEIEVGASVYNHSSIQFIYELNRILLLNGKIFVNFIVYYCQFYGYKFQLVVLSYKISNFFKQCTTTALKCALN